MQIRTVTAELLRAGPRHNQLLSPLTQYLGVHGEFPAGTVTLRYEHRDVERLLADLSYRIEDSEDPARREGVLEKTGGEMADVLSQIPGLAGALNAETEQPRTLTHLRIVLSASELAMLPFELSKVPAGQGASSGWLAFQTRMPVCITRHIRSVSAEGVKWRTDPRILFVAGPDTPRDLHRQALERVLAPWRAEHGSVDDWLVEVAATRAAIEQAVTQAAETGRPFTHVHILAHGAPLIANDRHSPTGVQLDDDEPVSGERLASVLTAMTDAGVVRPAVVTLATCDSGRVADVRTTDASVAHNLHDRGIPLVVASQFPLTIDGSVPFVERFYEGQLRGEHPVATLYDVRLLLHSSLSHESHDWASIVVYEALPSDFDEQLAGLRYWQTRRAQDGALKRLEKFVEKTFTARRTDTVGKSERDQHKSLLDEAIAGCARLPDDGPYALECAGLRAAGHKRIAQTALEVAVRLARADPWRDALLDSCMQHMDRARATYWTATKAFLAPVSERTRRKSNLHWLLGQVLSIDVVLGRSLDVSAWIAARMAATFDTESANSVERAWAYVSLCEQALLRLADEAAAPTERSRWADEVLAHATRIVELVGRGSEHAMTTSRQFARYVDVWGSSDYADALEAIGVPPRAHWHADNGLVPTAMRVVELLRGPRRAGGGSRDTDGTPGKKSPPPPAPGRKPRGGSRSATSASIESTGKVAAAAESKAPARGSRSTASRRSASMFDIEMLQAENGDCLWIEYGERGNPSRVLIDCGAKWTSDVVASRIESLDAKLDLFVLTHIDGDHISGVLPLFAEHPFDARFGDIWFNGWRQVNRFLSVKQGEQFSELLGDPRRHLPWNRRVTSAGDRYPGPVVVKDDAPLPSFELEGGMRLTLLSPGPQELRALGEEWRHALQELNPSKLLGRRRPPPPVTDFDAFDVASLAATPVKPDPSAANGSSIAFLAEYDGRSAILCGDAHADVLADSIRRLQRERGQAERKLKIDALKVSHHGSAYATTAPLLERIECRRYLVSTNGNIFYHPDREAIARILLHGGGEPTLYFNYRSRMNALWDAQPLRERYRYAAVYPDDGHKGLRVSL